MLVWHITGDGRHQVDRPPDIECAPGTRATLSRRPSRLMSPFSRHPGADRKARACPSHGLGRPLSRSRSTGSRESTGVVKTTAKIVVGVLLLGVAAWTGTFLYWHFRILAAIRTLESQSAPIIRPDGSTDLVWGEAHQALSSAGCRALPYLVGSLSPRKNAAFLKVACQFIRSGIPKCRCCGSAYESEGYLSYDPELDISLTDPMSDRERKCAELKTWWESMGERSRHQRWRCWSDSCRRQ